MPHLPDWVVGCAFADGPYFPIKTKAGEPGVSAFEAAWYGKCLDQMKEPRLPEAAKETNAVIYRMMILPTGGNPIAVRVQKLNGVYSISARRLDGKAGFYAGKLIEQKDIQLSEDDSRALDVLITNLNLFEMPTDDEVVGLDGVECIVEGVSGGKYHVVERWCPDSYNSQERSLKAFNALCRFLVDRSGLAKSSENKEHRLTRPIP